MNADPNDVEKRVCELEALNKRRDEYEQRKIDEDFCWNNGFMAGLWVSTGICFAIAMVIVVICKGCR